MAWLEKRKHGWAVVERQPFGSPKRYKSPAFRTRNAALKHLTEVVDTTSLGRRYAAPRLQAEAEVDEVVTAFISDITRHKAVSTVDVYEAQLNAFHRWMEERARTRTITMRQMTQQTLSDYWAHLAHEGRKRNTVNLAVALIQRLWRWAHESDKYGDTTPRPRTIVMQDDAPAITRAPTWPEMDACIANVYREDHWRLLVLMRFTGLRVGQAQRLRWDDINLETGMLTIRPELGKTRREKSGRVIPVSPHLVTELSGWGVREGTLVDLTARTTLCRRTRQAWVGTSAVAAVYRQPHHSFRKGWRTGLEEAGANERALEFLLGHDQGIVGTYVASRALRLEAAVALVPAIGATVGVARLEVKRG